MILWYSHSLSVKAKERSILDMDLHNIRIVSFAIRGELIGNKEI